MPFSARMLAVQRPIIPVVGELIRQHPGTISLGQGVVHYGPPQAALEHMRQGLSDPDIHKYKPVEGTAELVAAIEHKLLAENGIRTAPESRVVVTAGGTHEPVDPVRVLTNRSSGKQGFALAQAALDAGAEVTLIAAPSAVPIPTGLEYIPVEAASQMEQAVLKACQNADALLMAAAVADFRPVNPAAQKIKKSSGIEAIPLEPTTDILAAVAAQRGRTGLPLAVVGFAAETQNLLANAQAKLRAKRLDMIVANDVSAPGSGFAVDTNRVTLLYPSGKSEPIPLATKAEVAERVIAEVVTLLNK